MELYLYASHTPAWSDAYGQWQVYLDMAITAVSVQGLLESNTILQQMKE
jgi:hypothetical protein